MSDVPPAAERIRVEPTIGSVLLVASAVGTSVVLAGAFVAARRTVAWVFATALVAWLVSGFIALLSRRVPHAVAVAVTLVGLAGVGLGAWVGLGANVGSEMRSLQRALPPAAERFERRSETARDFELAQRVGALVHELDRRFGTRAAVTKATGTAPTYVVTGILLLFFLSYGPRYGAGALAQIADPDRRARVATTLSDASQRARRHLLWAAAQFAAAVAAASVSFWLLELPAPFGLGLLVGWAGLVPMIGMVLGGLPAILLAGVAASDLAIWFVVGLLVAMQLVEALVVRRSVDPGTVCVGPALAIIVGLVGFDLYGIGGATYGFAALVLILAVLDARRPPA
jgi:predicted PurR-regulated permease PerM